MTEHALEPVPVWTLATREVQMPSIVDDKASMTPERLGDLATLPAHRPEVTIEIAQEQDGSVTIFPALAG